MTVVYLLTDRQGYGLAEFESAGAIHVYRSPVLALMMNPVRSAYRSPDVWESEGEIIAEDSERAVAKSVVAIRRVPHSDICPAQFVAFGILCARSVYVDQAWLEWSDRWLCGAKQGGYEHLSMVASTGDAYDAAAGIEKIALDAIARVTFAAAIISKGELLPRRSRNKSIFIEHPSYNGPCAALKVCEYLSLAGLEPLNLCDLADEAMACRRKSYKLQGTEND